MVVEIETLVMPLDSRVQMMLIRLINHLIVAKTEDQLREKLDSLCTGDNYDIRNLFAFGFGAHHLWIHQKITDEKGESIICEARLIIVRF